jgi:hypothetical protein
MSDLLLETSTYSGTLANGCNTTNVSSNHSERHETSVTYMSTRIWTLIKEHDFHLNKMAQNHCLNVSCPAITYMWKTGWGFRNTLHCVHSTQCFSLHNFTFILYNNKVNKHLSCHLIIKGMTFILTRRQFQQWHKEEASGRKFPIIHTTNVITCTAQLMTSCQHIWNKQKVKTSGN